jgi:hypothetical protein
MINTNKYLNNLFTDFVPYILSQEDKKITNRDLKTFIVQKLTRKKFRKQKILPETLKEITQKVELAIKNNKPINFSIFFGGYKHFWNPSSPEIDWAEIFTFKFLTEWVSPIIVVYKPGVTFDFISEDWILERMNNYSNESLDKYSQSFLTLLEKYNQNLPKNLRFNFIRLKDKFNQEKMLKAVEEHLEEGYKRWNLLSTEEQEVELKRSCRSVIIKDNNRDRIVESRVVELAYYEVEELPEFFGNYFKENNIYISFSFGLSPDNIYHWIVLGSTYASVVDFWIGRGILEERDNGFVHRIVSKEQYKKIKEFLKVVDVKINNFNLNNFQKIEIINQDNWTKIYD